MNSPISPVKGTREFYPEDMRIRTWLYQSILRVSEAFGYQEFDGPFLEPLELYAAKSGDELVKKQSFVFTDRGGNWVTLRPELTPSLARMVTQRQRELVYPLRWWSFGPMWRYEQPQKGRSREFFQWNIDLIGVDSPEADAELAAVGASFFREVGLRPDQVQVLVNNRRLVAGQLRSLGIPETQFVDVYHLIDRRDKMSAREWEAYAQEMGLEATQVDGVVAMLEAQDLWQQSDELSRFFLAIEAFGVQEYVRFAPHIIRGLDYYTGTVFEAWDSEGEFRAILGGGRYDNLVADVGGEPLPGVGFAMGDVVVGLVLAKFGRIPSLEELDLAPVFVTMFDAESMPAAFRFASELRQAGLKVACYPEHDRLGKQLRYADRIGARVAIILGPDELAQDTVSLKDLRSGTQQTVPYAQAVQTVQELVFGPDGGCAHP